MAAFFIEVAMPHSYKGYRNSIRWERFVVCIFGSILYAVGVNMFLVPFGLYTGGLVGFSQMIRTILVDYLHLNVSGIDLAGLVYYLINIPIFIYAFPRMEKLFFVKTFLCVTVMTVSLALIPAQVVIEDTLASAVVGALISGSGIGMILRMSGSAGGLDVIGMLMSKKNRNLSVGKVNLIVNLVVYGLLLFMFDVQTVIYSILFAAVYSFVMDKVHVQNINVEVKVITKVDVRELEKQIFTEMGRGITELHSVGAYTGDQEHMLYILISKYEVHQLRQLVRSYDPSAFIIVNEGVWVEGNYLKKL